MVTLKDFNISLGDYNRSYVGASLFRMPAWFTSEYRRASPQARAALLTNPVGIDGNPEPALTITNSYQYYEQMPEADRAKLEEIEFNKLCLKAWFLIRMQANPTIGDVVEFLYSAKDPQTQDLLLSDEGKRYVSSAIRAAVYNQVSLWIMNNPYERPGSSSFSTNSGLQYTIDSTTWLSDWDSMSVASKQALVKSELYNPRRALAISEWTDFWKDKSLLLPQFESKKTVSSSGTGSLQLYADTDPVTQKSYVDAGDANLSAIAASQGTQIANLNARMDALQARVQELEQDDKSDDTNLTALEGEI